jgi:hypothetical protein
VAFVDYELLGKIYKYGGYATIESTHFLIKEYTYSQVWQMLNNLVKAGYLKKGIDAGLLISRSKRDLTVYKVTSKACNFLDRPASYLKREQEISSIIRSLIKQYFFCEIDYKNYPVIAEPEDRTKLLLEIGFKKETLPQRSDDFIIDARALEDSFVCGTNEKVFPLFFQLAVIHIDNQYSSSTAQLKTLFLKYKEMLKADLIPIEFIVVVSSKIREDKYCKSLEKLRLPAYKKVDKVYQISPRIMQMHIGLLNRIEIGHSDRGDIRYDIQKQFEENVKEKYSKPDSSKEEYLKDPAVKKLIGNIQENGMKAIEIQAAIIISSAAGKEEKRKRINSMFDMVYFFTSAGMIFNPVRKKDIDIDSVTIRVYRISRNFE